MENVMEQSISPVVAQLINQNPSFMDSNVLTPHY
jgi:hypothetical protein